MNKHYLLLRNNKKSGPYSLEELIQSGLKPLDLIWVEGKSAMWSYATEIQALKPYVLQAPEPETIKPAEVSSVQPPTTHQAYLPPDQVKPPAQSNPPVQKSTEPTKVYVSMPSGTVRAVAEKRNPVIHDTAQSVNLEQRAEELRKRIQSNTPENKATDAAETIQTKYSRTLADVEEGYTSWIYSKKSKNKGRDSAKNFALAVVVMIFLAGAYLIANYTFGKDEIAKEELTANKNNVKAAAAEPLTDDPLITSQQTSTTQETSIIREETPPTNQNSLATGIATEKKVRNNTPVIAVAKKIPSVLPRKEVKNIPEPSSKSIAEEKERTEPVKPDNSNNNTVAKPEKEEQKVVTEIPQKKKTLAEKLDGFFNKFKNKKAEDKPVEVEEKTPPLPGQTERKARRRGDATPPAAKETVSLADYIFIASNESSEKWMLGIHGIKLTVKNTSDETVSKAVIELRYYNEQNDLLETKTVNVANLPSRKSVTVAAPDHRLADHIDYRLVSAVN